MVKIGNVALDNGMPKICVPLVGHSTNELVQECRYLQDKIYDVVELRIDFLKDVTSNDELPDDDGVLSEDGFACSNSLFEQAEPTVLEQEEDP